MSGNGAPSRTETLRDRRASERGLAELAGLLRGVIADRRVSGEEAHQLAAWTRANPGVASRWPANVLTRRLEAILRDGRVDAEERRLLEETVGQLVQDPAGFVRLATDLPVDRPAPPVEFGGRLFVFAGEMAYGPLRACEREVVELGGRCERSVSRRTDYLVLGGLAAADWSQAAFGAAVDDVVRYRRRGAEIAIVDEEAWADGLR